MKTSSIIRKISRKLKWSLVDALVKVGWRPKLNHSPGEVRILVFHGVCFDNEPFINGRFIHQTQLDHLLAELSCSFHILSLDNLLRGELSSSKLNILCTFDDGYKNNLILANPLFEKHRIPFTIFCNDVPYHLMDLIDICQYHQPEMLQKLISHFNISPTLNDLKNYCKNLNGLEVKQYSQFLFENIHAEILEKSKNFWEVLTDEDLLSLAKSKRVRFGNHGALHLNYKILSENKLLEDLKSVTNRFERLNISLDAFAYPYGTYSATSISFIKNNGYKLLLSGDPDEKHPELKGRLTINPFISVQNQLIAIAKGHY